MKLFKVLITTVALGVASASIAQAQEKKGRGNMSPEQRIEQIEQAVGSLTDDQKTKIKAIYAKLADQMKGGGGDREKMGEMMQAARKDVRAVLTADQQKKFDAMPQGGRGGKKKN